MATVEDPYCDLCDHCGSGVHQCGCDVDCAGLFCDTDDDDAVSEADSLPPRELRCVRDDCPCSSTYNGMPGKHCCRTCARGTPCAQNYHPVPFDTRDAVIAAVAADRAAAQAVDDAKTDPSGDDELEGSTPTIAMQLGRMIDSFRYFAVLMLVILAALAVCSVAVAVSFVAPLSFPATPTRPTMHLHPSSIRCGEPADRNGATHSEPA